MMAFTGDAHGETDPRMVAKRDAYYGTNSEERRAHREKALDFSHEPSKEADHWMKGKGAYQLQLVKTDFTSGELTDLLIHAGSSMVNCKSGTTICLTRTWVAWIGPPVHEAACL